MCKTSAVKQVDFYPSYTDEPHASRRRAIRKKYPQVSELEGPDIRPVPIVLMLIASQLVLGAYSHNWSWPVFLLVAWAYGGTSSHALSLMTHELSHNSIFKTPIFNDLFGIFCNLGMGFPSSTMFKRYHMEHHTFQGDSVLDTDIPTYFEGHFFTNPVLKAIWLLLQPAFYALRPTLLHPKSPKTLDILNAVFILAADALIVATLGRTTLLYIVLSTVLGMGLHPCAGHFVAEHYVFVKGFETYSYYGILNIFCWNVGYHNEHHDFPRVPGWKLPQLKALAPEFYDDLPQHESWVMVLVKFVIDPSITPFSRVVRYRDEKGKTIKVKETKGN